MPSKTFPLLQTCRASYNVQVIPGTGWWPC